MLQDEILNLLDGTEELVLKRYGSDVSRRIARAFRRKSSLKDQSDGLKLIPQRWVTWYVPDVPEEPRPRIGDALRDNKGTHWYVADVTSLHVPGTLKCSAYSFDVHFGTDDYVDLYRKSPRGESPAAFPWSWSVFQTGIPAKLSARNIDVKPAAGTGANVKTISETRTLAIRGPFALEADDRFRTADGVFYHIRNVHHPKHGTGWIEILIEKSNEQIPAA